MDLQSTESAFSIRYSISNYGQTPAKMVKVSGQIETLPFPLPENFTPTYSMIGNVEQNSCVYPGIDNPSVGGIPAKNNSIIDEISHVKRTKDSLRVYLFGKITYLDCFNEIHHTSICLFIEPDTIEYFPNNIFKGCVWIYYRAFNDFD